MSRNISVVALRAMFESQTDEVFLVLLAIAHPDLASPLNVVNNTQDIESGGVTYTAFPFQIKLQGETEDQITSAQLSIDNVTREIVAAIRSITSAPTVTMRIVLASQPDTVEVGPVDFVLRDVSYDAQTVSGTLGYEDRLDAHIPKDRFTPELFPGLF